MKVTSLIVDLDDLDIIQSGLELYADGLKGIDLAMQSGIENKEDPFPTEEELKYVREKTDVLLETTLTLKENMIKDLDVTIDED